MSRERSTRTHMPALALVILALAGVAAWPAYQFVERTFYILPSSKIRAEIRRTCPERHSNMQAQSAMVHHHRAKHGDWTGSMSDLVRAGAELGIDLDDAMSRPHLAKRDYVINFEAFSR